MTRRMCSGNSVSGRCNIFLFATQPKANQYQNGTTSFRTQLKVQNVNWKKDNFAIAQKKKTATNCGWCTSVLSGFGYSSVQYGYTTLINRILEVL